MVGHNRDLKVYLYGGAKCIFYNMKLVASGSIDYTKCTSWLKYMLLVLGIKRQEQTGSR